MKSTMEKLNDIVKNYKEYGVKKNTLVYKAISELMKYKRAYSVKKGFVDTQLSTHLRCNS